MVGFTDSFITSLLIDEVLNTFGVDGVRVNISQLASVEAFLTKPSVSPFSNAFVNPSHFALDIS